MKIDIVAEDVVDAFAALASVQEVMRAGLLPRTRRNPCYMVPEDRPVGVLGSGTVVWGTNEKIYARRMKEI